MSISGIGASGYLMSGYETRKSERNAPERGFAELAMEAAQKAGTARQSHWAV